MTRIHSRNPPPEHFNKPQQHGDPCGFEGRIAMFNAVPRRKLLATAHTAIELSLCTRPRYQNAPSRRRCSQ